MNCFSTLLPTVRLSTHSRCLNATATKSGLGITRTDKFVFVEITTRRRTREEKENLYRLLCVQLKEQCDIEPSEVMVSITENIDDDWSFGYGRAQFLTGEL